MFSKVTQFCVFIIVISMLFGGFHYSHNVGTAVGELMPHDVNPLVHHIDDGHLSLNNSFYHWHVHEENVVTLSGTFLDEYADNEEEFDLTKHDSSYLASSGYFFGSEASGLLTTVQKE